MFWRLGTMIKRFFEAKRFGFHAPKSIMVPKIIFLWHVAHGCLVCLLCLCLFRLCIHVIYSGYSFMLSIQAIHSCYLFRLFIHAIYSSYSFMLSIQAIHSCYLFRLFIQAIYSGYPFRTHKLRVQAKFWIFQVLGHRSFGSKRNFDFLRKSLFSKIA